MPPKFGPQTISQEMDQSCAQEPIRILGTVQPHGFLLVVDIETTLIVQVSSGVTRHWTGVDDTSQILNARVGDWIVGLGSDPSAELRSLPSSDPVPLLLQPRLIEPPGSAAPHAPRFECVGHRVLGMAVLEWQSLRDAGHSIGPDEAMSSAASALVRLRSAKSLENFYRDCVREVSRLSGFDRVMMYKFRTDWTGEVVAEEVRGDLEPLYLGMRFPASDIPWQARALYAESTIRLLADVKSTPDTLIPGSLPDGKPLDQSHSALRGFSDVHRTYLGNMGVRATMSLSIVCDGKLWGLVACHHNAPRILRDSLGSAQRQACEMVAQVISLRIETLEQLELAAETANLDQLCVEFQQAMVRDEGIETTIVRLLPRLLMAFRASALCIRVGDWCHVGGRTHIAASAESILDEVASRFGDASPTPLKLNDLLTPGATGLSGLPRAAGLLAAQRPGRSGRPREVCAFMRPELVHEVAWAGEPRKAAVTEKDGRVRVEPRRSFALWKETVGGTAPPWSPPEADACARLLQILSDGNRQHVEKAVAQDLQFRSDREHLIDVKRANLDLEREVGVRIRAEEDLRRVNETLEIRVADRTAQYETLNRTLVDQRERFAIAADAAGLGFWDLDYATGLVAWDERMCRLFGLPPVKGDQPSEVWANSLHPDDRERCIQESADARAASRSYDTQYRIVHPNGAIRHLKSAGRITRDTGGRAIRMLGVAFDITERIHADEQFRHAIEAAPTGMLLMHVDGSIVLVNARIEALFGFPRSELLGRSIEMLIPERFRSHGPDFRSGFSGLPRAGETRDAEQLHGRRKDGSELPIDIGLNPLHTSEGELLLCSIVDLSKQLEIDRLRNELVSTVSHELRTPLTSISGALGLLESGALGALPDTAAEMVRIASKNSGRLARLINDMLDIGTLEAGKVNLHMTPVRLPELIRQAVEANRVYAEKYQVRFIIDADSPAEVLADPDRLTQVLTNLLSNAAKFSPVGADVFVRVRSAAATIRVEVQDSGPGISNEFTNRIFEKFAQADSSASRRFEGTGLGLSIARKLIEAMGGTIGFTTVVGTGATFHIEMPRLDTARNAVKPDRDGTDRSTPPIVPDGAAASKDLPKLLYVEDDADLITVIRATLAGRATIIGAHDIREAERLLRTDQFELIILDQLLPDGNGISLVDRISELVGHSVPIIVLSAADVPNDMHRKVAAALAKTQMSADRVAATILSYLPVRH